MCQARLRPISGISFRGRRSKVPGTLSRGGPLVRRESRPGIGDWRERSRQEHNAGEHGQTIADGVSSTSSALRTRSNFFIRREKPGEPARGWFRRAQLASALKNSLRQDPDVILVGEMRDPDTMQTAITAAEQGTS